tara:strand:- start:6254 stop:6454 length:201 start_codon:yes stop_codon:yes gene_type:complete
MSGPGLLKKLLDGDSTISTHGLTPIINTVAGENGVESLLDESTLDLDGVRPPTYSDNAPEGQSGRI